VRRLAALSLILAAGAGTAFLGVPKASSPVPTTTTLAARSVLVVSGHGWGHGIGMSQWGAYGYATHAWTFDRILAHYYPGTTLGRAGTSTVRVLLAQEKKTTLVAAASWTVTDSTGQVVQLDASTPVVLTPKLVVGGHALTAPLTFRSTQPLSVDGKAYHGRIVVAPTGKLLQVVDAVGLEAYVKGVVPEEMPSNWPAAALQAQAVAARSYALANLVRGATFDVFDDSRSQIYGGAAAETPASSAAVDATRRQVLNYDGEPADTMFFSSSGGRTESATDAIGTAVPYLVSVADPYDTLSPYHDWGPVVLDLAKVAKSLHVSAPIDDIQVSPDAAGRVRTVTVLATGESSATFSGARIRAALGLRSTWFTPSLLQLLPPKRPVTYGGAGSLTGFARDVSGTVSLEAKTAGGDWAPSGDLVIGPDGAFASIVRPQATTDYRLAWGNVHVAQARVRVAPLLAVQQSTAGIEGTVRPQLDGAAVELQQQNGSIWTTTATTSTDAAGAWSFAPPAAGAYRVRVAPGHGLVPAVSATLQVQ
jgi:stage II sporulation protein D